MPTQKVYLKCAEFYHCRNLLISSNYNLCFILSRVSFHIPLLKYGLRMKLDGDTLKTTLIYSIIGYVMTTTSTFRQRDCHQQSVFLLSIFPDFGANLMKMRLKYNATKLFLIVHLKNIFWTNCKQTSYVRGFYALTAF